MAVTCKTDEAGYTFCYEPVSKKVERLERELADLKAKQAAEAEKARTRTPGEQVAVDLHDHLHGNSYVISTYSSESRDWLHQIVGAVSAKKLAAAIDKAIADAKAEQRESDARLVDGLFSVVDGFNDYCKGRKEGHAAAAAGIRNNK